MANGDPSRALEWVERVADFCAEQYGMPPITGRILGWLMICDPAEQSAGEIADAIGASRASLTSNMRLLTAGQYVCRRTRPGERTSLYRIDDDAWFRAVRRKLASLATFQDIASEGLELLGPDNPGAGRVRAAHESFAWVSGIFENADRPPAESTN